MWSRSPVVSLHAADDRIVEEVTRGRDPASLTVVAADRDLRRRVEALGARTAGLSILSPRP